MPFSVAAPSPHAVFGIPRGYLVWNAAEPARLKLLPAFNESCGKEFGLSPCAQTSILEAKFTTLTKGPSSAVHSAEIIKSATFEPFSGLEIAVAEATFCGATFET